MKRWGVKISGSRSKVHFSLLIFLVCMLFTILIWDHYLNSKEELDRQYISYIVLLMGSLFSVASGLFVWSLEKGYKIMEAAAKEAQQRQKELEEAYGQLQVTQERLKDAMQTNEVIVNLSMDGIFTFSTQNRRILSFNPAAEKAFGIKADKAIGKPVELLLEEAGPEKDSQKTLVQPLGKIHELNGRRDDGTLFPMEAVVKRDSEDNPVFYICTFRDLTDRKKAEAALRESENQLRQTQKMDAIGRLAGGIAHDFNNLLTAITACSDLTLQRMPQENPNRHLVEEIKSAAEQAAVMTRQLLTFSRKERRQIQALDLNAIIQDMEGVLHRLIGEQLDLAINLQKDIEVIRADPAQIQQVILNLVVNARDATPMGGKVIVSTENIRLDKEAAAGKPDTAPGDYVLLSVTDTGIGMDEQVLGHLFEPFFTTKSRGTGLGLSTVYGIVKQNGGSIFVSSKKGEGTTFQIYFPPAAMGEVSAAPQASLMAMPRGTETILVVEDEERVRNILQEILISSGYHVLAARSPEKALALFREHRGPIHLMVTDVVMPKMNGVELAEKILSERPGMRVLFISGYNDIVIPEKLGGNEGHQFLQKPFTPSVLTQKIRQVLDQQEKKTA